MATIAEQLTSLANTKAAIKDAIVAKGVSVADTDPFSAYPTKIGEIQGGGGVPATKFGVNIDDFLGGVDENGVYVPPSNTQDNPVMFDFSTIKKINSSTMKRLLAGIKKYFSVDFSNLEEVYADGLYEFAGLESTGDISYFLYADLSKLKVINESGLENFANKQYMFIGDSNKHLNLGSLETVGRYGLQNAFQTTEQLESADLSLLKTVDYWGMYGTFLSSGLKTVNLDSLETIGTRGLASCFRATKITSISFPALISVQTDSFGNSSSTYCFGNQYYIKEIHFRADMQATIEAMTGYANRFGAQADCIIYFDL